ncbi:hypothetical protein R1sor_002902 [Riccia sorocarpa]|uniref:Bleomycin resistance protein n=1 Tax=Riccia sorocarpa TaxID=122646 RepID=A0ABD3H3H4_9MARC
MYEGTFDSRRSSSLIAALKSNVIMEVVSTMPIFRIFDLKKAREFYIEFLGFKVDWEYTLEPGSPTYMQVSRAGCILHLTEHHGDSCPGSTVFLKVKGLEDFHKELSDKQYPFNRPGIEMVPWNAKMMEVIDPFGNRLRFNEYLSSSARTEAA